VSLPGLSAISVVVGVLAGLAAVMYGGLIAFFHNLLFLGKFSFVYNPTVHTAVSPWGAFVILIPVAGAVGVSFLVKNFAPETRGSGVPDVIHAIYYNQGVIRPVVAVIKSVASALSLGSGASVGREGPIAQIGASFGSAIGQLVRLPAWQRIALVTAGAGGGIAATFNTPVGGVLFAIEIMLQEISVRTFVPVALCSVTATYIGQLFLGAGPSFAMSAFTSSSIHIASPWTLLSYVLLGAVTGIASALYIKVLYGVEGLFNRRLGGTYYRRHITGMLLVGLILYLSMTAFGHYYVGGLGYATVQDVVSGALPGVVILLVVTVLKLAVTSLSLGSGAAGGIFSPALFMGAAIGGTFGTAVVNLLPEGGMSPAGFAVAGMAGMVGGSTGAALAAIVMVLEMTLDYNAVLPLAVTVVISYGVRRIFLKETIYTLPLVRRGHYMPQQMQSNFYQFERARDVMETRFVTVPGSTPVGEFMQTVMKRTEISWYIVEESGRAKGVIHRDDIFRPGGFRQSDEVMSIVRRDYTTVRDEMTVYDVIVRLKKERASVALIASREGALATGDIKGIISRYEIGEAMTRSMEPFSGA
jgi:CIC family chloride channel protein